jgi:predicted ATPase
MLLAEATGHAGRAQDGLAFAAEARVALERSDQGDLLSEAHRLEGDALLAHPVPDLDAAEHCFQRALGVAQQQEARSWELRAKLSLSRLRLRQGRRQEARETLESIHRWFAEGRDTADLRAAQGMLAELHG